MKKYPLRRRDLVRLLEENGFRLVRTHGSHIRYEGSVDGRTRRVEVDQAIDEFTPSTHRPLGGILSQLGFFDETKKIPHEVAWERFFAGSQRTARSARVAFRRWDDPYWKTWY